MITPKFSIDQDDDNLYIKIYVKFIRAQDLEFDVQDNQFRFYANPYFLRLTFPGQVVEDENSKAHLDLSGGVIDVTIAKVEKGLHFEDLDLLSKLLATKSELYEMENPGKSVQEDSDSKPKKGILIEELGEELKNISIEEDFDDETEESDWEMPQEIPQDEILNAKYGFNRQYNGYFTHVHETANEILEVPQVEKTSNSERVELQKQSEDAAFDEDYYMENFVNEQEIQSILEFIPKSVHTSRLLIENEKMKKGQDSSKRKEKIVEFTERERDVILSLPRRDYLIDNKRAIYLGLIDILFGYCYNERVTESEPDNVESAWTIGKLTGTCSFLREYEDIYQVLQSNIRRALTYPLYRNWNLAIKALEDVTEILRTGNKVLLTKIMLEIKYIFDHHSSNELYCIYSRIYFDDYCVWIQKYSSSKTLVSMGEKIKTYITKFVDKSEITGWPLVEYEELALLEESEVSDNENSDETENSEQ